MTKWLDSVPPEGDHWTPRRPSPIRTTPKRHGDLIRPPLSRAEAPSPRSIKSESVSPLWNKSKAEEVVIISDSPGTSKPNSPSRTSPIQTPIGPTEPFLSDSVFEEIGDDGEKYTEEHSPQASTQPSLQAPATPVPFASDSVFEEIDASVHASSAIPENADSGDMELEDQDFEQVDTTTEAISDHENPGLQNVGAWMGAQDDPMTDADFDYGPNDSAPYGAGYSSHLRMLLKAAKELHAPLIACPLAIRGIVTILQLKFGNSKPTRKTSGATRARATTPSWDKAGFGQTKEMQLRIATSRGKTKVCWTRSSGTRLVL